MSAEAASAPRDTPIHSLGRMILTAVTSVGDLSVFSFQTSRWVVASRPKRSVILPCLYQIGVQSVPVVIVTGAFLGMVLAVQGYDQFHMMRMETRLGAVITIALVKELGPVLAATMLAGRVGSAMSAELGTMRVTEQIDALRALGANPVQYLVVPRFLACVILIPMLTAIVDGVGMLGGWFFSTQVLGINSFHYWHNAYSYVSAYDIMSGLVKSTFFGAAIALIACHRGFNCGAGAEGVGRAATEAFVLSFMAILILDFFLGIIINVTYYMLWSQPISLM